jgi:hypothetical protein
MTLRGNGRERQTQNEDDIDYKRPADFALICVLPYVEYVHATRYSKCRVHIASRNNLGEGGPN